MPGIERDFVDIEQSKYLFDLGYSEDCIAYWQGNKFNVLQPNQDLPVDSVYAPMYSQAFRFLRIKFNLFASFKYSQQHYCFNVYYFGEVLEVKRGNLLYVSRLYQIEDHARSEALDEMLLFSYKIKDTVYKAATSNLSSFSLYKRS